MEVGRVYYLAFKDDDEESRTFEAILLERDGTDWTLNEIREDGGHVFTSVATGFRFTSKHPHTHFLTQEELAEGDAFFEGGHFDDEEEEEEEQIRGGG